MKFFSDRHAADYLAALKYERFESGFGEIESGDDGVVTSFREKSDENGNWINGGFFVMEPGIFRYLKGDMSAVQWEKKPLIQIADDGQLVAFKHHGFWKCMDTLRDKTQLNEMWSSGNAKWKV